MAERSLTQARRSLALLAALESWATVRAGLAEMREALRRRPEVRPYLAPVVACHEAALRYHAARLISLAEVAYV